MDNQKKIQSLGRWDLAEFLYNVSCGAVRFSVCEEECKNCDYTEAYCISQIGEWLMEAAKDE